MKNDHANEPKPLFTTGWEGVVFELEDCPEPEETMNDER
jgi:hypothetical protein